MSLPSYAIFYNNGKEVGAGFCNPGWTVTAESLMPCISQAMDDAWDRYRPENKELLDRGEYQRNSEYFTTEEDLKNFDYMELFDIKVPRHIALHIYFGQMTLEEWAGFLIVEAGIQYKGSDSVTYTDAYAQYILTNMRKCKKS